VDAGGPLTDPGPSAANAGVFMKRPIRIAAPLVAAFVLALTTAGLGAQQTELSPAAKATEANITRLTASLLEHSQFAHHPLDSEFAAKFLDRYLDALDGSHSLFLQTDLEEFAPYRASLAQATRASGDASAAHVIFARYLQRLEQRVTFVTEAVKGTKFDFTGHDSYSFDRTKAPRPRDLAAAKDLWRQQLRAEYLQEKLGDKKADQIASTLTRRYAQQLRTAKEVNGDEVLEIYLNALAHVYDPHSDYMGHEQMESFSIAMNLSLFGIGAVLENDDGYCKIRELVPGGPAAKSGLLKPGDRIVAVAQGQKEPVEIINMPLTRAVQLIRGPKGSTVVLTILPAGAADGVVPKKTSLVRDEIKLEDQEAKANIIDLPSGQRLGVLDLPSFYAEMGGQQAGRQASGHRSATADVARLLTKLKAEHVTGVVLDLRRNGGGSLDEAINLTGLFIRKGPVVQTRGPAGDIELGEDNDSAVLYDGPLIVLVSRFSASASEILAGALQDYGRAVLVGDSSTFGKGTVQNVLPLARAMDRSGLAYTYDPGALKVTIRKFYRPSGASTQLRGVASDIVLPSTSDFKDVSEGSLKDPLTWDSVPAARFEAVNRVQPYLTALRERSSKRVATDKAFALLADEIARVKKSVDGTSVSLNEAERRKEVAQAKARKEERERESRKLRATRPATYEITVKNSGNPGLPAPLPAPPPEKASKSSSAANDDLEGGPTGAGHAPADDVIMNEGLRILADYVGLLDPKKP
jgi:carboxyl-terminal processing protease